MNFAINSFGWLSKPTTARLRSPPVSEARNLLRAEVPDLLATDVVLINGSSASLVQEAAAAGVKTLMMTGNLDRIIEFGGAGQPYLSKPFSPEAFLQRIQEILSAS